MMRARWVCGFRRFRVLLLLPGMFFSFQRGAFPETGSRNVVLICWDTVRQDHLSCYRERGRGVSPHLEALAAEGLVFNRCISTSSWTKPAIASVLTGEYPWVHGAVAIDSRLREGVPTLAGKLRKKGYRTEGIVSLPSVIGQQWGFAEGFDAYDDVSVESRRVANALLRNEDTNDPRRGVTGRFVTDLAKSALERLKEERFFLFLHYFDPHAFYEDHPGITDRLPPLSPEHRPCPASEFPKIRGELDRYDGEIQYTDSQLGPVIEKLRETGLDRNTVVVLFADHGEEFLDHGGTEHGYSLNPEVVRVPAVVWGAGIPARRVDSLFSLRKLHDFILEIPEGNEEPEAPESLVFASLRLHGLSIWAAVCESAWVTCGQGGRKPESRTWLEEEKPVEAPPDILERLTAIAERGALLDQCDEISEEDLRQLRALSYF